MGAVDQLSFQSPFIPIVFFGQTPGFNMSNFFTGTPTTNANAVPPAGTISPAWLPCLAQLTSFPDPNGAATYGGCSGPGVNSTQNLFVLEVPRHFVVPNTQQWNLTLQRELGKRWVLEVGYVGTHGVHLRETRDAIQSVDAAAHPFTVTDSFGSDAANTCLINVRMRIELAASGSDAAIDLAYPPSPAMGIQLDPSSVEDVRMVRRCRRSGLR